MLASAPMPDPAALAPDDARERLARNDRADCTVIARLHLQAAGGLMDLARGGDPAAPIDQAGDDARQIRDHLTAAAEWLQRAEETVLANWAARIDAAETEN